MKLNDQVFQNVLMNKTRTKLIEFWEFCTNLYKIKKPNTKRCELEDLCLAFESKTQKMQVEVQQHKTFLEDVLLIIPLKDWLEKQVSNTNQSDETLNYFKVLIEQKIIPSHDSTGRPWTLQLQREYGHEKIIESIRCYAGWTVPQSDKIVSLYLAFSQYLALITFGFVPYEEDPDRIKTARKVLPFEAYQDFISQLSERDALIAALLYYGGPTTTEVLGLKASQIDCKSNSITYLKETIFYPHHVMRRLQPFIQSKKPNSLVFLNRTGEEVNRSRLFRNFKNASAKMSSPREISPAILVESKSG